MSFDKTDALIVTYILRTNNDQAMSEEEIMSNAQVLITAGSETAASCLTCESTAASPTQIQN